MTISWELYAHEERGYFWHAGPRRWVELHGLSHPIVPVLVTLDPDGPYWGWQDAGEEEEKPSMIWPHESNFRVCFAYGYEASEKAGNGRHVKLRIERREETAVS